MFKLLAFFLVVAMTSSTCQGKETTEGCGRIVNPGTNYEYSDCDKKVYLQLGDSCQPAGRKRHARQVKTGLCKATLFCNPKTYRCDCEDSGPYLFTAEDGKCRNYVGSRCFDSSNCVKNADCVKRKCVCQAGRNCVKEKIPA